SDHLSDGPMPVGEVLRFGVDLARALRQLHERGATCGHLDPACIELTEDGVELLPVPIRTEISPYTAPEQILGKHDDPRSDLFALGAVLSEMLTGHRAFAGDTPAGLRTRIMEDEPPPLAGVSPPLARIVMKCLEKRPERRLQRA